MELLELAHRFELGLHDSASLVSHLLSGEAEVLGE